MRAFKRVQRKRDNLSHKRKRKNAMKYHPKPAFILAPILILCLISPCEARPHATIPNEAAIRAIIGEAEGESYEGQVALAEVIRRRGSLSGVYGAASRRAQAAKLDSLAYRNASRAWFASLSSNLSLEADGWGSENDVKIFRQSKWFKKCYIVKKIGNHYFWKVKQS